MKRTLTAASVAVLAVALAACSPDGGGGGGATAGGGGAAEGKDTVNIGTFLDMTVWDPSNADIGFEVVYMSTVYDPLVALDEESNPIPALATDWEYSDDFLTLTMNLRDDVTFDDGEEFNAEAAVANLEHLKEGVRSQEAYLNVDSFEAVDEHTIEVHLTKKDDALLYFMGLGRSWMVSPAAIESGDLDEGPVGSGPYEYDAAGSNPGSEYKFTKKDDHWNADLFPFENVNLHPIDDPTASLNAMLSGQLDVNYSMPDDIPHAEENDWGVFSGVASWVGLQFADRDGDQLEPIADVRVRQALNYAVDALGQLESAAEGSGELANQFWATNGPIFDESLNDTYDFNIDKAKELMDEAGYGDGFDVTMPMSMIYQPWQPITEQVFGELGISISWEDMSPADYQKNAPTYPMFLAVIALDSNPVATLNRQVTQPQWYNPEPITEVDEELAELTEQAEDATGDEQLDLIREINEQLVDKAAASIWYQANNLYFAADGITVTPITGTMFPHLRNIQLG